MLPVVTDLKSSNLSRWSSVQTSSHKNRNVRFNYNIDFKACTYWLLSHTIHSPQTLLNVPVICEILHKYHCHHSMLDSRMEVLKLISTLHRDLLNLTACTMMTVSETWLFDGVCSFDTNYSNVEFILKNTKILAFTVFLFYYWVAGSFWISWLGRLDLFNDDTRPSGHISRPTQVNMSHSLNNYSSLFILSTSEG